MSVDEFWKLWEWEKEEDKAPFFGELTMWPEKSHIFVERELLIERAYDQLELQRLTGDSGITLVCGSPGVGKSTFIDQLIRKKYKETGKRISLIGYVENPYEADSHLTTTHLLEIFSEIEGFLNEILKGKQSTEPRSTIKSRFSEFSKLHTKDDDFIVLCDIITETIIPKCRAIHELRSELDHYYLAIDDVDYLLASEQIKLLSILCAMAGATSNPSILYTARPAAAGIAKHSVTSLAHHRLTESIRIPAIDPYKVIDARITHNGSMNRALNPFSTETTRQFLTKISNGNLRLALDYAKKAQNEVCTYLKKTNLYFSRNDVLCMLFGSPVTSKNELSLMANLREERHLVNLFCSIEEDDPVPVLYVALVTTDAADNKKVDLDFCNLFNRIAYELNPKGMEQKEFSEEKILSYLRNLHKNHLIRRKWFTNIEDYLSNEQNLKAFSPLKNTIMDLTARGDEMLLLTRDLKYQELAGLQFWRKEIQDRIKKTRFLHAAQLDGNFLLENFLIE